MTTNDTRQQMVLAAIKLFQQHGYHGTSWRTVVREAGTPWGSIAHHFPGGKVELGCAAIEIGAEWVDAMINKCFAAESTVPDAVALWFERTGLSMKAADYQSGCPVASIALAISPPVKELSIASQKSFKRWENTLAQKFATVGIVEKRTKELAGLIVTLFEGGIIRCRIYGSHTALKLAGDEAKKIIENELAV